jgi:Linalool dehydratase/isomerase
VLDLALQPHESWQGFFFVRPEQFREGAVRYQLNFISYTAAMYQYSCAPAFTGYAAEAQRNVIAKMLCRPVWSYWAWENAWGNLRWNPDPIINDNVMYSGYLGLMLGLYETDRPRCAPYALAAGFEDVTILPIDHDLFRFYLLRP